MLDIPFCFAEVLTFAKKTMFFVQALSSPITSACYVIYSTIVGSVYPWKVPGIDTRFDLFWKWISFKELFLLIYCEAFVIPLDSFFVSEEIHACVIFCCEIREAYCEKHFFDLARSVCDTIGFTCVWRNARLHVFFCLLWDQQGCPWEAFCFSCHVRVCVQCCCLV
jgi:hypothetical protein